MKFGTSSRIDSIHLEKIGNLIIYLSYSIPELFLTKLLKLVYIIDELSVKRTGIPVTWLDHKAWSMGPVAIDLYFDIKTPFEQSNNILDYINIEIIKGNNNDSYKILPKKEFDNSEFSSFEIGLIKEVIDKYGNYTGEELIDLLHHEKSLWYKVVKKNALLDDFKKNKQKISLHSIPLHELNKGDPLKKQYYREVLDAIHF